MKKLLLPFVIAVMFVLSPVSAYANMHTDNMHTDVGTHHHHK